jgi:hypothetical protein
MNHIETQVDPRNTAGRGLAGGVAKFATATATIATCALSIMIVLGNVDAFSDARDQAAGAPAGTAAGTAPYFPAQYQLNAPDAAPEQIATF